MCTTTATLHHQQQQLLCIVLAICSIHFIQILILILHWRRMTAIPFSLFSLPLSLPHSTSTLHKQPHTVYLKPFLQITIIEYKNKRRKIIRERNCQPLPHLLFAPSRVMSRGRPPLPGTSGGGGLLHLAAARCRLASQASGPVLWVADTLTESLTNLGVVLSNISQSYLDYYFNKQRVVEDFVVWVVFPWFSVVV